MNTIIGIYRYFGEQLSDMCYFHNLLTPVLSPPEKAVGPKTNKFTMSFVSILTLNSSKFKTVEF